ncbi:HAMP domain-containing sensor histidine kinase [Cytobacillus sp. OWB-43]|uniref:sensor histidine kinase n=1 Tax=Cytobacillus sp. OWB-43 TaxID=3108468 RepID=UPI002AFEE4EF|nr:HAMP domain-containing sensor histidine kinase [Cytobacillus sp. OWB-43]MEA1854280.1 HAMP domain-containing sensor histidine kinase [Cytobacillus sp. OWB-43]
MSNQQSKPRESLLRYWTTRYLLALCVGLLIIAFFSVLWIRHTTVENRLNIMELMAEEIADRFVEMSEGKPIPKGDVPGYLNDRGRFMDLESDPLISIVDTYGNTLTTNRPQDRMLQFAEVLLNEDKTVQELNNDATKEAFYVVKVPITYQDAPVGWVVMLESKANLAEVNQEYRLLAMMIIGLALIGWAAIYFLSKRLSKPIQEVAEAAREIQAGNYQIDLKDSYQEQELYELVHSFKEMSKRLEKLETLRTELLAGVTHELKTPVTSIDGLLQAVHEGVVEGEEAKEFIKLSILETEKMKKMVEDLLAFNTYATNVMPVQLQEYEINQLIKESVYQWEITHEVSEDFQLVVYQASTPLFVHIDQIRLQQILINLLNNAFQAMDGKGKIEVKIDTGPKNISIKVNDSGKGIPDEEVPYIFERFFRGQEKKLRVRGLGLGLPFSKLIAQSMNGDLILVKTSECGTEFMIELPYQKHSFRKD